MKMIKNTRLIKFIIIREECNNEKKLNNEYRSAKKCDICLIRWFASNCSHWYYYLSLE